MSLDSHFDLKEQRIVNTIRGVHIQTVYSEEIDTIYYIYQKNGKYFCLAYTGKRVKHAFWYRFSNEEKMDLYIQQYEETLLNVNRKKEKEKIKNRDKKLNYSQKIIKGSILYGYPEQNQNNINFFQVIERPSEFVSIIQQINYMFIDLNQEENVYSIKPILNSFSGPPIKKLIGPNGIRLNSFNLILTDENTLYYKSIN